MSAQAGCAPFAGHSLSRALQLAWHKGPPTKALHVTEEALHAVHASLALWPSCPHIASRNCSHQTNSLLAFDSFVSLDSLESLDSSSLCVNAKSGLVGVAWTSPCLCLGTLVLRLLCTLAMVLGASELGALHMSLRGTHTLDGPHPCARRVLCHDGPDKRASKLLT